MFIFRWMAKAMLELVFVGLVIKYRSRDRAINQMLIMADKLNAWADSVESKSSR